VAYQRGNQVWVAAVGDSRVVLCGRRPQGGWRVLPMTIDHRPRRQSERQR
jgi:serine/threonine protein phosphatase PrpC